MRKSMAVWMAVSAAGLVGLSPLLASAGVLPGPVALGLFGVGALVGFIAFGAGAVTVLRGRPAPGVVAMALGLGAMAAVLLSALLQGDAPVINDVTTDVEAPPAFVHARTLPENTGKALDYPGDFKPVVRKHYPHLQPLSLLLPPQEALALVERTARGMPGWEVTAVDRAAGTVEAVATSRVFRLHEDVVIRVQPTEDGSRVDVRSRSRFGRGDMGSNARRIEDFLRALSARSPALAARG